MRGCRARGSTTSPTTTMADPSCSSATRRRRHADPAPQGPGRPGAVGAKEAGLGIILGGNVTVPVGKTVGGDFAHIPACRSAGQTGCVIAYSSFSTPPPADSLFGRVGRGERAFGPAAGQRPPGALCEPRRLGRGQRHTRALFPNGRVPGPLGANDPGLPYATPWVSDPTSTGRSASTAAAPAGCRWTAKPALATTARSCPRAWGPPGAAPRGREPRAWQPGRHRAQRGRRLPRLRPGHVRRARRPFEVRPQGHPGPTGVGANASTWWISRLWRSKPTAEPAM